MNKSTDLDNPNLHFPASRFLTNPWYPKSFMMSGPQDIRSEIPMDLGFSGASCTTNVNQIEGSTEIGETHLTSGASQSVDLPLDLSVNSNAAENADASANADAYANLDAAEAVGRKESRNEASQVLVAHLIENVEEGNKDFKDMASHCFTYSRLETMALLQSVVDVATPMMSIRKSFEEVALEMRRGTFWDTGNPSLLSTFENYVRVGGNDACFTRRHGGSLKRKWKRMVESIIVMGQRFFDENALTVPKEERERTLLIKLAEACFKTWPSKWLTIVKPGTAAQFLGGNMDNNTSSMSMVLYKTGNAASQLGLGFSTQTYSTEIPLFNQLKDM